MKRKILGLTGLLVLQTTLLGCPEEASNEPQPADMASKQDQGNTADLSEALDAANTPDLQDMGKAEDMAPAPDLWQMPDYSDTPPTTLGGERPAAVTVPSDYNPDISYPLIVVLHGYASNGRSHSRYFGLAQRLETDKFVMITPDGNQDELGNRFWNASASCCDVFQTEPDDFGYISGLIREAKEKINIDHGRVYLVGHSNGGFMSYRLACDLADRITAVVSVAGSTIDPAEDCNPKRPVSVLQVHGTSDNVVLYRGGRIVGNKGFYPAATETAARWATLNGCNAEPTTSPQMLDIDRAVDGEETTELFYPNCQGDAQTMLWTLKSSEHSPSFTTDFTDRILSFLLSQDRSP